ncbi:hypothetical protein RM572_13045 [Streptomyces sp. DSM 42041]|uniref:Carbon monoxide dehydrogenase subunit G n=1 Tax=Streptomyces hazeniae TaxID=3075538 RepID=A0ABU2NRT4_9ACTN|nr:hypothetical protein [Streptomyces sp. DSM 42041]MDT0379694.1 hypothetical protein [Streptomyces sp. DSM 42041]
MEHEVYVPFSVGSVRAALAERERVARCVPGLHVDAASGGGDAVEGRLRVRIGGSTITYRGSLTLIPQGDGFTVEGSGTEARGSGTVKLALKLVPHAAEDGEGTRLTCSGTVTGEGRLFEHEQKTTVGAGRRLLDRFCSALEESLRADGVSGLSGPPSGADAPEAEGPEEAEARSGSGEPAGLGAPDDNERVIPGIPGPETGEPSARREEEKPSGGLFDADVPPSSLDPTGDEIDDEEPFEEELVDEDAATAEAAHARRTMIGRSAEEVDHAPPRGRYAPVPSPQTGAASDALRWAAPAAAAVLAGAVVLTRALRRRR